MSSCFARRARSSSAISAYTLCGRQAHRRGAGSIFVHGQLLVHLWDHLGFDRNRKRIPGWILGIAAQPAQVVPRGLPRRRWVHSGLKFEEGVRHEFSTVSEELKDDLIVALARFGICPSVGKYDTTFKQRTGERRYPFWRLTVPHVTPWSPLDWDRGCRSTLAVTALRRHRLGRRSRRSFPLRRRRWSTTSPFRASRTSSLVQACSPQHVRAPDESR